MELVSCNIATLVFVYGYSPFFFFFFTDSFLPEIFVYCFICHEEEEQ